MIRAFIKKLKKKNPSDSEFSNIAPPKKEKVMLPRDHPFRNAAYIPPEVFQLMVQNRAMAAEESIPDTGKNTL